MVTEPSAGSLVCVGTGMTLGAHLGPRARRCIEQADVVFAALADIASEQWISRMHPDVRSLQALYAEGRPRMQTYREMVAVMLAEVRAGRRVCGVFYGHPGVFAWAPHRAIEQARREGFEAHMEAAVSAADCLYADLGIDPGRYGCQHFEASQFLLYRRRVDPAAWLVLWQPALAGDRALTRFASGAAYRQLLVEALGRDYPAAHDVVLYRAPTLPIHAPLIRRLSLSALPATEVAMADTLVVPPAAPLQADVTMRARLDALDAADSDPTCPA